MIGPSRNCHQHHASHNQVKIDVLANPHSQFSAGGERPPVPTNHSRPKRPNNNSQRPLKSNGSDFNISFSCIVPIRKLLYMLTAAYAYKQVKFYSSARTSAR
jgi:hypothetical protein